MFGVDSIFWFSAFLAGVLMFLAPCTLPLVPAYLAFIAGVPVHSDVSTTVIRRQMMRTALYYCAGFSVVFIVFGVLAGLMGALAGTLREVLLPIAGLLIIAFGLSLLHIINLSSWFSFQSPTLQTSLNPGTPLSALVMGGAFALGWTPCIGPVLGTILLLASTEGTVVAGALLLTVFSLGLAIPFLLVAYFYALASKLISQHPQFSRGSELVGGVCMVLIGLLLLTNNFDLTIVWGTQLMEAIGFSGLLDYY